MKNKPSIKKPFYTTPRLHSYVTLPTEKPGHHKFFVHRGRELMAAGLLLVCGFMGGAAYMYATPKSVAESFLVSPATAQSYIIRGKVERTIPLADAPKTAADNAAELSNDALFNLPFNQLEQAMNRRQQELTQQAREEWQQEQKEKVVGLLKEYNSPFVGNVDDLLKLSHWKLVLAISFAESSLGKRCPDNNCGGIGVEPGHPLWRTYSDFGQYMQDLDRLLERRYKDWSLEDMCGVYVQPCNPNWLLATRQIFGELEERGIE